MTVTPSFWSGRRVLLTGHTGFKGGWLAYCLCELGAEVTGVGLPPVHRNGIAEVVGVDRRCDSHLVDLRDRAALGEVVRRAEPDIVLHLAAQALVLEGIAHPADTFATNVVGTANLLEACNEVDPSVVLVVTSDKVYANDGSGRPFVETDRLGGGDPYSASKAAAEIVAESWRHTFAHEGSYRLATARAGNVIGGGDWAAERLLPDVLRSFAGGTPVLLRHPGASRPWQHVLEPVAGYLAYAEALAGEGGGALPLALNFGPEVDEVRTVAEIAQLAIDAWGDGSWVAAEDAPSAEAPALALDARLARASLGWQPRLRVDEAVRWTVEWFRALHTGGDPARVTGEQLADYRSRAGW